MVDFLSSPFPVSLPPNTIVGNVSPISAPASAVQISKLLTASLFTTTAPGIVPGSGGGTVNFLRADGTWAAAGVGSLFTAIAAGIVPASGGGTANFLRADGTWVPIVGGVLPPGSNGQVLVGVTGTNPAFSSTPVLGVAGSVLGILTLSGNTAGTVAIKPSASAGNWNLTLPPSQGTAGYSFVTDGSGFASWTIPMAIPATFGAI